MKKYIITALVAVLGTFSISAQSALGLASRSMMQKYHQARSGELDRNPRLKSFALRAGNIPGEVSDAFVTIAPGFSADDLTAAGAEVLSVMGDIAVVTLPTEKVEEFATLPCVRSMNLGRRMKTAMNEARRIGGVDDIHNGVDLPRPYTGKGVCAGIVDQGFDPNHINFRNDDGSSRVKFLAHMRYNTTMTGVTPTFYSDYNDLVQVDYPLSMFTTDSKEAYHGSHTLGIMAGSYDGPASVAVDNGDGTASVQEMNNPFYGVATDSDILIGCGDLNDSFIAYGISYIVDLAAYMGQPVVINLSIGSNVGAHDPRSQMNSYLDYAADLTGAIICVSAGNEGDIPLHVSKEFTADDTELKTILLPTDEEYTTTRYGQTYIYSDTEEDFDLQVVVINTHRNKIASRFGISGQELDQAVQFTQLGDYLTGTVTLQRMVDPDTGRYYVMTDYYVDNTDKNDGRYQLGFLINGKDGQRVDAWCDGYFTVFDDFGLDGWAKGSTDGTISDMACGYNVIPVGSYNTRNEWASLDGMVYNYKEFFPVGDISLFSSYGTLADGRSLPLVCAPGAGIVSSTSHYYVNEIKSTPGVNALFQARVEEDGRVNYWQKEQGTSMSTPYVAGTIATWLEADPTLTPDDVKDIITSTAITDDHVTSSGNPVQWGAGKFNAAGGLREVIRRSQSGIEGITADPSTAPRVIVDSADGRVYDIFLGGATAIDARLYDTRGAMVTAVHADGDNAVLDASTLAPGIYILNVNDRSSVKIAIR